MIFKPNASANPLGADDLDQIKETVRQYAPGSVSERGIDQTGFILLSKIFAERGRHETIWIILRKFHYTDSLSLRDSFLRPKFDVPPDTSVELSPAGYRFFVDLFLLFDKDNDGGLNASELSALFAPTPGLPPSWLDSAFPSSTVRNEAGHITLQGWLAQWSMTTFFSPATTLAYLAYLGFTPAEPRASTTAALHLTKARKRRKRGARVERNVLLAYVLGGAAAGKSALLDAFLARPFSPTYHPTIKPRTAVNTVELPGGKQCTLILEELGELEAAILDNPTKLAACDILVYAYDSSDPDSFAHLAPLRARYPHLNDLPGLYVALKADQDKATQRTDVRPEDVTAALGLNAPLHVSVTWTSISELFVQIAEAAMSPGTALPRTGDSETGLVDRVSVYMALAATVCAGAAFLAIWKRVRKE
jgi:Ras family protein T1